MRLAAAALAGAGLVAGCRAEPPPAPPPRAWAPDRAAADPIFRDTVLSITPRIRRGDERQRILEAAARVLLRHYLEVEVLDDREGRIEARRPRADEPARVRERCEVELTPRVAGWWLRLAVVTETSTDTDPDTRENLFDEPRVNRFLSRYLLEQVRSSLKESPFEIAP